jgi:CO/xanthine dehydrogenase FAD-binding subunit
MDLNTVEATAVPTRREDIWPLGPGDAVLAGGTWLFSEPQPQLRRLVDITRLGWVPVEIDSEGIELAATCTLTEVAATSQQALAAHPDWAAAPLLGHCCTALLASFKIWETATVGGNICLSFPAGSMISLATALDGSLLLWRSDGSEYRMPVEHFVTGASANRLGPGEIVRSLRLPAAALRGRTAMRKLAPSPLGRSGVVVIARRDVVDDGGGVIVSVTAATVRPYVFRFPEVPTAADWAAAHAGIPDEAWTLDPHGDPDWRRAMTRVLGGQVLEELR